VIFVRIVAAVVAFMLVSILFFVLTGCAAQRTAYHAYIDPAGFTPDQIEAITAGLDTWHAADPRVTIDVTVGVCTNPQAGDGSICITQSCDIQASAEGETYPEADDGGAVKICLARVTPGYLDGVAAHEAGHAMGILQHSPDPADLMFKASTARAPTANDLEIFWSYR